MRNLSTTNFVLEEKKIEQKQKSSESVTILSKYFIDGHDALYCIMDQSNLQQQPQNVTTKLTQTGERELQILLLF